MTELVRLSHAATITVLALALFVAMGVDAAASAACRRRLSRASGRRRARRYGQSAAGQSSRS